MDNIAVYVNKEGFTSQITETGYIRIYTRDNTEWSCIKTVSCAIDFNQGLAGIKRQITEVIEQLDGCRIFVAAEISGQLYYLLEVKGFSSYEGDGIPEEILDSIILNQLEEEKIPINKEKATELNALIPTDIGGVHIFNLKNTLEANPTMSSKMLLKPFLMKNNFNELLISCDHIPGWFGTELKSMGFCSTERKLSDYEYQISIKRTI